MLAMTTSKSKYFTSSIGTRLRESSKKRKAEPEYETFKRDISTVANQSKKVHQVKRIEVKVDPDYKEELIKPIKPIKKVSKARKTTRTRRKRKTKVKKESNDDDSSIPKHPPANFWPMYNEIKKMRSKIVAPVDKVGCANISTAISGLKEGPVWRFQVLITLMLSSQTKDEVNYEAMKGLQTYFTGEGYKDGLCLQAILDVDQAKLDELIYKVGFHHRKASYIKRTAVMVRDKFGGEVPKNIKDVTSFPGVGPKMGFLFLQIAWGIYTGIGVDTHMARMTGWFHWVPNWEKGKPSPEYVRKCLESMLSDHREVWGEINHELVGFGQMVCLPTNPRCDICTLAKTGLCPAVDKRLLCRVEMNKKRGVSSPQKKSRGDLSRLIEDS